MLLRLLLILCFPLTLLSAKSKQDDYKSESKRIWQEQSQLLPPYDLHWLNESDIHRRDFKKKLLNRGERYREFIRVREFATRFERSQNAGFSRQNMKKSRNKAHLPYDDTRTLRHKSDFYFAASDVHTDKQTYIVTQAPFKKTIKDFWTAVLETKTTTIVKLMNTGETSSKIPVYYKSNSFPYKSGNWTINFLSEQIKARNYKSKNEQKIIQRWFVAKNKKTDEDRLIKHVHYENWPDRSTPDPKLFAKLLEILDEKSPTLNFSTKKRRSPMLVHCKAGLGRSGTFVLAHTLRQQLLNGEKNINPAKILTLMRMQRKQLVSSGNQYQAALRAALSSVQKRL